MNDPIRICFPEYSDLYTIEETLKEYVSVKKVAHAVRFDLKKVRWIGVLQLSILYGWISEIRQAGQDVFVTMPVGGSDAASFLASTSFANELTRLGCQFTPPKSNEGGFGLAAFKLFPTRDELLAYEQALLQPQQLNPLLGNAAESRVVREGTFRTILLHELCDNAFIHGYGKFVRYAVAVYPSDRERKTHPILASFGGAAYLEVVVSDSGDGLISNDLKKQMPPKYQPDYLLGKQQISEKSLVGIFAFEFSSTKDPEARKRRIAEIMQAAAPYSTAIATGLWFVNALVRHYGGQLIVRTGSVRLSIDYSRDSRGIVAAASNLGRVTGTHILVRVPRQDGVVQLPVTQRSRQTHIKRQSGVVSVGLDAVFSDSPTPAAFVLSAEKAISAAFVDAERKGIQTVGVLCDGLSADQKTLSVLLMLISLVPRRNRALIFFGMQEEQLSSAKSEWQKILDMRSGPANATAVLYANRSFLLFGSNCNECVTFGEAGFADSTVLSESQNTQSHLDVPKQDLAELYFATLKDSLSKTLWSPLVLHPSGFYFLFEDLYYTDQFFEVARLVNSSCHRQLVRAYLENLADRHFVGAVYSIADPLATMVDEIGKGPSNTIWAQRGEGPDLRQFLRTLWGTTVERKTFLLMTDVICTGDSVLRYLAKIPDEKLRDVIVLCFVDGRDKQVDYFTVERGDPIKVRVVALHRVRIRVERGHPDVDPSRILVVDRRTHSPKAWDSIAKPTHLPPEELIKKANSCGALLTGHIEFEHKHYTHFLRQLPLIEAIWPELEAWWRQVLDRASNPDKPKQVNVMYLDEGRGWESKYIPDFFSTKVGTQVHRLTVDEIFAPYPKKYPGRERAEEVWLILGAMAHGRTTARALEYVTKRYETPVVRVFIVFGRMDTAWLSFWQSIERFSHSRIFIDVFSYLPLESYDSSAACPLCNLYSRLEHALHQTEGFSILHSIVQRKLSDYRVQELTPEQLISFDLLPSNRREIDRTILRCLFQDAIENHSRRKELERRLKRNSDALFELIKTFSDDALLLNPATTNRIRHVSEVLYRSYDRIENAACHLMQGDKIIPSLDHILGVCALVPRLVESDLPNLFVEGVRRNNQRLCEDTIVVALLVPLVRSRFFLEIHAYNPPVPWAQAMVRELRAFPHLFGNRHSIEAFFELLWLLTRSTSWNDTINALGISARCGEPFEKLSSAYRAFEAGGLKKALSLVERLKVTDATDIVGSLWGAIKVEAPQIDETLRTFFEMRDKLRAVMDESNAEAVSADRLGAIAGLRSAGRELLDHLQMIFRMPVDVKGAVMRHLEAAEMHSSFELRWRIDPRQTGILIALEDLKQSLLAVLENAKTLLDMQQDLPSKDYWVEIEFEGPNEEISWMKIRDNLPWERPIDPTGGLRQFGEYCRKYAAPYEFNPHCETDPSLRIRVAYRTLPKR